MTGERIYVPSTGTFGTVISTRKVMGMPALMVREDETQRLRFYVGTNDDLVYVATGLTRLGVTYDGPIPQSSSSS
ncbi:FirrV-1-B53 [Feldmannia irregularis virus a]|uniref:FirrV-1-B53 n=1 Tax=Feldmannia irregularis virus a TaxID=231992 RepID=Q6XLY3_9PHYC|nr:FirrV-1-B53 [Feldmannia irregularis virus a]AAR26928.1 FirrV-1-B53 [Feldmannia irregularis virus a]